jgi:hypothetical protein
MKSNLRQTTLSLLIALTCGFVLSGLVSAQEVTGTIVGSVRDRSGAVVPGATVTISDPTKDNIVVRTITANNDGEFSAPNLQSGIYQVTVEAANFKKNIQTEVKLDIGQRRQVNVELEAGNINETVTVKRERYQLI